MRNIIMKMGGKDVLLELLLRIKLYAFQGVQEKRKRIHIEK